MDIPEPTATLPTSATNGTTSNMSQTAGTATETTPPTQSLYELPTDYASDGDVLSLFFRNTAPRETLSLSMNDAKHAVVKTADGYTVEFTGADMAWTITSPDGKSTRIWGDPHVSESDGTNWDFTKQSTFYFGDNKITVEVAPWGSNGATVTKTVSIYNGEDRVTMTDLDQNKPRLVAWDWHADKADKNLADGDVYRLKLTPTGLEWVKDE